MNSQTQQEQQETGKGILQELREAGLFPVATVAVLLVAVYALGLYLFSAKGIDKLGQLGDSFGALTALLNALAFAAVVATVVLQSRELRESRQELVKQAAAQQAWADAAVKQIELTKQLEATRIRPVLKAEWHRIDAPGFIHEYRIRNVGLGVGIVRRIEVFASTLKMGELTDHSTVDARDTWHDCLQFAASLEKTDISVKLSQFDDLNRALAPGESQALIAVTLHIATAKTVFIELSREFRPIIHFESISGEKLSTLSQFDQETANDQASVA